MALSATRLEVRLKTSAVQHRTLANDRQVSELRTVQDSFFASGPPCPLYDGVFEKSFDGCLPPMLAQSRSPSPTASLLANPQGFANTHLRSLPLLPRSQQTCNQFKRGEGTAMSVNLQRSRSSTPEPLFEALHLSNRDRHVTQRQPSHADVNYGAVAARADPSDKEQKETESIEMEELKPLLADSHEISFQQFMHPIGHSQPMKHDYGCTSRPLQRQGQPEFMSLRKDALRRIENSGFQESPTVSKVRALESNGIDAVPEAESDIGKRIVVTAFDTMSLFGTIYDSSTDEEEFEPRLASTLMFRNSAEPTGAALRSNLSSSVLPVSANHSKDESPLAIANSLERRLSTHSLHESEDALDAVDAVDAVDANNTGTRSRSDIEGMGNIVAGKENNSLQANGELNGSTVRIHTFLSMGLMQAPLQLDQLQPDIFGNETAGISVTGNGDDTTKRNLLDLFKRKYSERVGNEAPNVQTSASLNSVRHRRWRLRVRKPQRVLASMKRLDIFTKLFKPGNAPVKEEPVHLLLEDSSDLRALPVI
ncbi:hypothetical protein V1509DRAFT_625661 [Lipomyces kononenkoae]